MAMEVRFLNHRAALPFCPFSPISRLLSNTSFSNPEPVPELFAQLAQETYSTDLLHLLVVHIARFDFEARKDVVQIFNNLLRRQIGARWPTVEYISGKREVLFAAHAGYENEDIALNTGMILREMLRHEPLCKILLYSEQYGFILLPRARRQAVDVYVSSQVLQLRALYRVDNIRHFNGRVHEPQRNSHAAQTDGLRISRQELRPILQFIHDAHQVAQLRDEAAVAQAAWRDTP